MDQAPIGSLIKKLVGEVEMINKEVAENNHLRGRDRAVGTQTLGSLADLDKIRAVSSFSVKVPVLSLQSTSMPSISFIVVILFVIAPFKIQNTKN
uniref:Uncharacterized protein n=1 Tax=Kalanchoe fedtschenkoi TaxID=63787 RepID=A0A7N1A3K6_KALFE